MVERRRSSERWGLRRRVTSPSPAFIEILRGLEGKYFFPTRAQAENLGAKYAKMGLGEQTITSGRIGTDVLRQFGEPLEAAGEGPAFFLRNESLRHITNVTIEGPLR